MANDMADSLLMSLPLEIRHKCFQYVAVRDTKSKNLLRYWFEKKEVTGLVATAVAANPAGPAPQVVYEQEDEEDDSEVPQPDEDEDDEDADGEGDEHEDDGVDEENDEVDEENEDGDGDGTANQDQADDDEDDEDDEVEDGMGAAEAVQPQLTTLQAQHVFVLLPTASAAPALAATQAQQQQSSAADQANGPDHQEEEVEVDGTNIPAADTTTAGSQDADGDEIMTEENEEDEEDEEDAENDGEEDFEDDGDEDVDDYGDEDAEDGYGGDGSAATPQQPLPPPPAPVVAPARKWRHIAKFMRITQCPPPVELLLTSKQLNSEAKNWFYDVAVLRINATGSFAHTSFFEETLDQITEAAFSPMENIRKVEVLFSWDTTWLRADTTGCAESIFPALLRQRSEFVHKILSQAPDLKQVTIHWHDSAEDNESANFMLDILAPFHSLNVHLAIKEHYIAVNAKPNSRSIAGQRRVEFQAIMDSGLDRL